MAHLLVQWSGVGCFSAASLACVWAAWRPAAPKTGWLVLAFVMALLTLEVHLNTRSTLLDMVRERMRQAHTYETRQFLQWMLLIFWALLGLSGLGVSWVRASCHGWPLCLAVLGAWMAVAILGVELVSLHAIDALLYAPMGPVRVSSWLLASAVLVVVLGVAGQWRRSAMNT